MSRRNNDELPLKIEELRPPTWLPEAHTSADLGTVQLGFRLSRSMTSELTKFEYQDTLDITHLGQIKRKTSSRRPLSGMASFYLSP